MAIFNRLKNITNSDSKAQIRDLVKACDLDKKLNEKSKTLSGGQKRKLQLAMMFTGGSRVCCVDEVSSGLDPLSRRKIWDILLAERGARTFLFTTHALDEADVLSDQIAVLSRGNLKAAGSAVELKHRFGGGYRVHIHKSSKFVTPPEFDHIRCSVFYDQTIFQLQDSAEAAQFIGGLEKQGVRDYEMNGPTIEDVFLRLAEEGKEHSSEQQALVLDVETRTEVPKRESLLFHSSSESKTENEASYLLRGKGSTLVRQTWILFRKRIRILSRNYLPYWAAILVPILAAALVTLFLTGFDGLTCSPGELANNPRVVSLASLDFFWGLMVPVGPSSQFTSELFPLGTDHSQTVYVLLTHSTSSRPLSVTIFVMLFQEDFTWETILAIRRCLHTESTAVSGTPLWPRTSLTHI